MTHKIRVGMNGSTPNVFEIEGLEAIAQAIAPAIGKAMADAVLDRLPAGGATDPFGVTVVPLKAEAPKWNPADAPLGVGMTGYQPYQSTYPVSTRMTPWYFCEYVSWHMSAHKRTPTGEWHHRPGEEGTVGYWERVQ